MEDLKGGKGRRHALERGGREGSFPFSFLSIGRNQPSEEPPDRKANPQGPGCGSWFAGWAGSIIIEPDFWSIRGMSVQESRNSDDTMDGKKYSKWGELPINPKITAL